MKQLPISPKKVRPNIFKIKNPEDAPIKEIISVLNRRFVMPFYIPVLCLCCSLLLIKTKKKYLNQYLIYFYSFIILLFTELGVRYTGLNNFISTFFIITPFILLIYFYFFLYLKFNQETKKWITFYLDIS